MATKPELFTTPLPKTLPNLSFIALVDPVCVSGRALSTDPHTDSQDNLDPLKETSKVLCYSAVFQGRLARQGSLSEGYAM